MKNKNLQTTKMKLIFFILLLSLVFNISCKKENIETEEFEDIANFEKIIGKWEVVAMYSVIGGGFYSISKEDSRIEEYTREKERILYDYLGTETARCEFKIFNTKIKIFGEYLNGEGWESEYKYWFTNDTLVINNDGGFEYYNEFLIKIK